MENNILHKIETEIPEWLRHVTYHLGGLAYVAGGAARAVLTGAENFSDVDVIAYGKGETYRQVQARMLDAFHYVGDTEFATTFTHPHRYHQGKPMKIQLLKMRHGEPYTVLREFVLSAEQFAVSASGKRWELWWTELAQRGEDKNQLYINPDAHWSGPHVVMRAVKYAQKGYGLSPQFYEELGYRYRKTSQAEFIPKEIQGESYAERP